MRKSHRRSGASNARVERTKGEPWVRLCVDRELFTWRGRREQFSFGRGKQREARRRVQYLRSSPAFGDLPALQAFLPWKF